MDTLLQDLRFALRMLGKSPGTTTVAVIALALGIGASTTMFAGVNGLVLKPFPFPGIDRVVAVYEHHPHRGLDRNEVAPADYLDWRRETRSFERLAAYLSWDCNLSGLGAAERLQGHLVAPEFFAALGVRPALGRDFVAGEDRPESERVVILSDGLWRRRFGADPAVLGRTLKLNGTLHVVVGVMPRGIGFPPGTELWTPLRITPELQAQRNNHRLLVVGRLKPGVGLPQARAEMRTIAARLEQAYPQSNTGWTALVFPLLEDGSRIYRSLLYILLAAVGFVLLIACANVANLMLARAATRSREIAIRAAIGAGRRRIVRQLLTESLLLSLVGASLGLLLAAWGGDLMRSAIPADLARMLPGWDRLGLDGLVLGFTLALSMLTSLACGLAPALEASRPDLVETLKETGDRSGERGSRHRLRGVLVVAQVAMAVLLLIGAGLMLRSFARLQNVDPGFEPEHVLTMKVLLPAATYDDSVKIMAYFDRALERLRALPGVREAGAVNHVPLGGSNSSTGFTVEGRPAPPPNSGPGGRYRVATPGYFDAMGIPVLKGRGFQNSDREEGPGVAVINQALARLEFPDQNPLGVRLRFGSGIPPFEIVGVVGNVKHASLSEPPVPEVYLPQRQDPHRGMFLVARTAGDPASLGPAARRAIEGIDPDVPVYQVQTMRQLMSGFPVLAQRLSSGFLSVFALIAVVLAAVGIFGVMSYAVAQRTREIGVRMALGARPRDVLGAVVGEGLRLTLLGLALGLVGSVALGRALRSLLYGVTPTDPATYAAVSLLLGGIALLACWVPARRATRVDPMQALRNE